MRRKNVLRKLQDVEIFTKCKSYIFLTFLLNKNNVQEQFRENTIKTFSWQLYKHQTGTETVYLHIFDKEEEELEPKPLQSH